jgi:hypothetical protein
MPAEPKPELISAEEIAAFVAHPVAEIFPIISSDELRELAEDIRKNGMIEPITLFEGKILDGRNRLAAGKSVSFPFRRNNFRQLLCSLDPQAYVISANIKRRHLTAEQKRELIAKLLKANPAKSDRQVADVVKVDNKTVSAVREKLEAREEIPHVETRNDSAGRKQPAKKKSGKSVAKGENEKITYQKVVNAKTALNAYHVLEEHLLDALQDLNEYSDFSQADDCARRTIEKLEERLGEMQSEEEKEAA